MVYLSSPLIKLIAGPRRSGKSVLALQMLENENFAYLNFDDDLLLKNFDEDSVSEALNEVYPDYDYLLLDEIQNLNRWELWVTKLYRRGVNLVITGSNAKLLSHEMATSLTGRYLKISVFPFSFAEFLKYHGEDIIETDLSPQRTGTLLNYLNTYINSGGFPEVVLNPAVQKNYLSSLFNFYSFNSLKVDLGFSSVATVQKFTGFLEEPYLFLNLSRYDKRIKLQQKSPKKSYVIDNGFIKA